MSQLRSTADRKRDVLAVLEKNGHAWLATASPSGNAHLIAVASWWDGKDLVIATRQGSATAKNLQSTSTARLGIGSPDDVIMVDVTVEESMPVSKASSQMHDGFVKAVGWDPAEEGSDWAFFRLRPARIEAYRGYGELKGRRIMQESHWLA